MTKQEMYRAIGRMEAKNTSKMFSIAGYDDSLFRRDMHTLYAYILSDNMVEANIHIVTMVLKYE